jgi:uncharacterized NAD(P)/FAD-binding protein YdhS
MSPRTSPPDASASAVAVIGGGASGLLIAAQLLRQSIQPLLVLLYDPQPMPDLGTAYSTSDTNHLLNVPAGRMSALPEDPDHFLRWLNTPSNCARLVSRRAFTADDFVPRAIYARYISHILEEAVTAGKAAGCAFRRLHERAVDFESDGTPGGWLTAESGDRRRVTHVVLAVGNQPPRDPLPRPHAFFRGARYVPNVWRPGALDALAPGEDLLLAGSGLTALDVIATLNHRGHAGHITVISRNGQLPAVHRLGPAYDDFLATAAWPATLRGWVRLVRREIARAAERGLDWRPVFDALRCHTPQIWSSVSLDDRRRFLRHVRPFWESRRHRAAPQTFAALEALRDAGQLEFRPGRLADFAEGASDVTVTFTPKGSRTPTTLRAHRVLNCIGPESNFRHHLNDPLLVNLLARGTIDTDPLLLGLAATPEGHVIGSDGLANPDVTTLGPPLRGILWETTAIPEIRQQASRLAAAILAGLFTPSWEI